MSRGYTVTRIAESELDEQVEYLAQTSLAAAVRLYRQAIEAFERIAAAPEIGGIVTSVKQTGIRVKPIRGFPQHLIFYRLIDDHVEVVRIMHAARDWGRLIDDASRASDV